MLLNYFHPIEPAALEDLPDIEHSLGSVQLLCLTQAAYPRLIHVVDCFRTLPGEQTEEHTVTSAVVVLLFIDHYRHERIELRMPMTSEHTLSLSNGPLAEMLLLDEYHMVQVSTNLKFTDASFGAMGTFNKRYLEVVLLEQSEREHLHTFWQGDFVKNPIYDNHTSSLGDEEPEAELQCSPELLNGVVERVFEANELLESLRKSSEQNH